MPTSTLATAIAKRFTTLTTRSTSPTQGNTTRPMGEIAVGVGTVISHAYIDVGYRYRKAFHNVNDSFNISHAGEYDEADGRNRCRGWNGHQPCLHRRWLPLSQSVSQR